MTERHTDHELVGRAQSGDKRAFDLLVLRSISRSSPESDLPLVRDPSEVMDVTQEAFIKAYRALPEFPRRERVLHLALPDRGQYRQEPSGGPGAASAGRRHRRRGGRADSTTGGRLREHAHPGERHLLTDEIAATVQRALEAICRDDLRTAIVLRELEG
jgi:RNA polymerase sigma-70 factor, ECF subfamily